MKTILFKSGEGKMADVSNTPRGWLAVGEHTSHHDGTVLLSSECCTVEQLRRQADRLHRLIDEAVVDAERDLPSAK